MNNRADLDKDLVNGILEFARIVTTAKNNFDQLDVLLKSLTANNLVDDPNKFGDYEYKTYFGYLFNYFKPAALDTDTHRLFVTSVAAWNPMVALLANQVANATKPLSDDVSFAAAKRALINLTTANRPDSEANLMMAYIANFETVYPFVQRWNELNASVKAKIEEQGKKQLNLSAQQIDSLFGFAFKHVTSLQLHLHAMSQTLSRYSDDVELQEIAKRFAETSKLIGQQIHRFNESAPKVVKRAI